MADEAATELERMRKARLEALRAGMGRVNQLEPVTTAEDIEKRIEAEYARYGARRPELDE